MKKCAFCGGETETYQNSIPICLKCAEDYARLVEKTPEKSTERPPDPGTPI
jgi:hypothetical protein